MQRLLLILFLLFATAPAIETVHAQVLPTQLPTPQMSDHGNGAATSDVAGGAFIGDSTSLSAPAIAFGIPTAFGPHWGGVFAGLGVQNGLRYARHYRDGAAFGGFGLGQAERLVGLEVTAAVYSLVGNTGQNGSLGLKLHRRLGPRTALAAGVENLVIWGRPDGGQSAYLVGSHRLALRPEGRLLRQAVLTAGLGNGRFNSEQRVRRGENRAALFASLGLQLSPRAGLFGSWTGQDLNLGLSVVPAPERLPVVLTPVVLDVTGRAGDGPRLALALGLGYTF